MSEPNVPQSEMYRSPLTAQEMVVTADADTIYRVVVNWVIEEIDKLPTTKDMMIDSVETDEISSGGEPWRFVVKLA